MAARNQLRQLHNSANSSQFAKASFASPSTRRSNCEAEPLETVHVKIPSRSGRSWEGMVHVFQVSAHPKATQMSHLA
jgi:hypothetical protein